MERPSKRPALPDVHALMLLPEEVRLLVLYKMEPLDLHYLCVAAKGTTFESYCDNVIWPEMLKRDYGLPPKHGYNVKWMYLSYWLADGARRIMNDASFAFRNPDWPSNEYDENISIWTFYNPMTQLHTFEFYLPRPSDSPAYDTVYDQMMALFVHYITYGGVTVSSRNTEIFRSESRHESVQLNLLLARQKRVPAFYYHLFSVGLGIVDPDYDTLSFTYIRSECIGCGAPEPKTVCGHCNDARYCNQACANAHWSAHKN